MIKKISNALYSIYELIMITFFIQGIYLFLWRTAPLMKNYLLIAIIIWLLVVVLIGTVIYNGYQRFTSHEVKEYSMLHRVLFTVVLLLINGLFIYTFLYTALFDYFQPFSVYDPQIYAVLYGVVMLLGKTIIDAIILFVKKGSKELFYAPVLIVLMILAVVSIWGASQSHFEYENGTNVNHLFKHGDDGYQSYRIPSILVIPEGSTLGSGETLSKDMIVVFSEARKDSSNDNGDIDLGIRYSKDAGETWSDIVFAVDLGSNKIGNLTPVFDRETGIIQMIHLRKFYDDSEPSGAYIMTSNDGGITWSEGELLFEGKGIGPGHGIQIEGGTYDGRLVVPGYSDKGIVYLSDDNGATWIISEPTSLGNETEIAQLNQDTLIMTTRVNIGMALPHDEIHKHFSYSYDGGGTWTDAEPNEDVLTPICMSGLVTYNGVVYYSGPQDYYARANMYILQSLDQGTTFTKVARLYKGAAGYSDIGVLSDGRIVILFENGAVEYDERLTFMIVDPI